MSPVVVQIPLMPPIDWSVTVATLVILGCVTVGAVLICRGLRYSRGLTTIMGAMIGWAIVDPVSARVGQDIPRVAIYCIMLPVGAVLGFVLSRLVAGLTAAGIAGVATLTVILTRNTAGLDGPPQFNAARGGDALGWLQELCRLGKEYLDGMGQKFIDLSAPLESMLQTMDSQAAASLAILLTVMLIGVLLGLFLRRVCLILLTSLLGSLLLVSAWALGAKLIGHVDNPAAIFANRMVWPAIMGLTLVGILVQSLALQHAKDGVPTAEPAE